MAQISWNEVKDRAIRFSCDWADAKSEQSDKQTFWNEFFEVFGIRRRNVAVFEEAVLKETGRYKFIDLLQPGQMVMEHKSRGASLSRAESQAFEYCADLIREGRHDDVPRFIVICDFARFALYDLEPDPDESLPLLDDGRPFRHLEFELSDLHSHVREFSFIRGEKPVRLEPEHPANMKATQLLADLHDALKDTGYTGHALERYLVRCLFCLFAEDTGVFEPHTFLVLVIKSKEDGSDLGARLAQLWDVLNTPPEKRQTTLDEDLAVFPYVNGDLFSEPLPICSFNTKLRERLLECSRFFWARISPAVFGSIFQGVMDDKERRQIGAHYTSERDIMKLLNGLCLDDLRAELQAALADRSTRRDARLAEFQDKLRGLRFFDPACGCGNFLILAYRELRRMEQEVLVALHTMKNKGADEYKIQTKLDVRDLSKIDVDQFYGIEISEWPIRIAEVGLWLADHQCNLELGEALGQTFRRLPLQASPTLRIANALRIDWREVLPPTDSVYVLGNPPFVGSKFLNEEQSRDMECVCGVIHGSGVLDYVTAWYIKAAEYVKKTRIHCAFVSTNSITQGEQVAVLWGHLFNHCRAKIHFAHRTFAWASEARGKAHVHVVIIGFGLFDCETKTIFEYDRLGGDAVVSVANNINPYLLDAEDVVAVGRSTPICSVAHVVNGSIPADGGNLILKEAERDELLVQEPQAARWLRPYVGAVGFINNEYRYCLWLVDCSPDELRKMPAVMARVSKVREMRVASAKPATRAKAATPTIFTENRQPCSGSYLAIPRTSSENRRYIPMGFLSHEVIAANDLQIIPGSTLFEFGVLSSIMHMSWVAPTSGRLKSDPRYSVRFTFNTFPWPEGVSDKNRNAVESAAQAVLDARDQYPKSTLADLYDPLAMPAPLVKAHAKLDRAVDRCYRGKKFQSDRERVEHLFAMYEKFTAPLIPAEKPKKRRRKKV